MTDGEEIGGEGGVACWFASTTAAQNKIKLYTNDCATLLSTTDGKTGLQAHCSTCERRQRRTMPR